MSNWSAKQYAGFGALVGLLAPTALLGWGMFQRRPLDPIEVAIAMAIGGALVFSVAGWLIGRKEVALHAKNEELRLLSAKLTDLSTTDPLTKISNRRVFDERLGLELARAQRHKTPLALVMLDLDHFKKLNDQFGHRAGDEILRRVAATLEAERRQNDLVARYGGEELVAILPSTDAASAAVWAERIRQRLETEPVSFEGHSIGVAASFGVAGFDGNESVASLIDAADRALYQAKSAGRNRVAVASLPRPAT